MPSARLFSPLHRLIPVIIFPGEVPVTGRVRKESVKVRTPESPTSTDDSPLDLSTLDVFPHGARAETQHVCRLAQREQTVSDRFGSISSGGPVPRSRVVLAV